MCQSISCAARALRRKARKKREGVMTTNISLILTHVCMMRIVIHSFYLLSASLFGFALCAKYRYLFPVCLRVASFSFMYLVRNSGSNWQNDGMSTKVKCCGECIHCCDLVSGRHSFAVWYEEANYMCYCSESRVKIIITE